MTNDLREALAKLVAEAGALDVFESEVRAAIGNTNFALLMQRVQEAEAILEPTDDQLCTNCWGSGITCQTERRCACQPPVAAVELMPCPFCGAEIHEVDIGGADLGEPEWLMVACPRCATTSGASANKRLVIERWNTRATASGLAEAIEALQNIAEGNLGDGPRQANYDRIREAARATLTKESES